MADTSPPLDSLEQLKKQAKDLLAGYKAADAAAYDRIRANLAEAKNLSDGGMSDLRFTLKNAQLVIAREYGFQRWVDLKNHVVANATTGFTDTHLRSIVESVEAGAVDLVREALEADPGLATAELERDGGEMARLTLLHRTDTKARRTAKPKPAHAEIAQLLIDHGADMQAVVKNFATPLEVVSWSGNDVIAEVLLRNGANPNFGVGGLPVDTASSHGNRKVFKQLIEAGADYTVENTIELGMVKETRALIDADVSVVAAPFARGGSPLTLGANRTSIVRHFAEGGRGSQRARRPRSDAADGGALGRQRSGHRPAPQSGRE